MNEYAYVYEIKSRGFLDKDTDCIKGRKAPIYCYLDTGYRIPFEMPYFIIDIKVSSYSYIGAIFCFSELIFITSILSNDLDLFSSKIEVELLLPFLRMFQSNLSCSNQLKQISHVLR